MYDRYNMIRETAYETAHLLKEVEEQEREIEILRLIAAKYKSYFFGHDKLGLTLQDQITENNNACIGEFDGFGYASWRARAVFRTLEDMVRDNIITEKEYNFCNEMYW